MKLLTYLLVFLFSLSLYSQRPEIHCKHFFLGYPYGAPSTNDLIIRDGYALSSNDDTKFADWVVYRMTKENLGDANTNRNWDEDPWLDDSETLEEEDYKNAHKMIKTDRGHQAPLADFKGTPYWYETNYLSNITPQKSELNQGPWRFLEEETRQLLDTFLIVFVMTGPLYERDMPPMPGADEDHVVPSAYWKIIAAISKNKGEPFSTSAFILDQETPRSDDFRNYVVSINEVEERSGLDFFWELDDEVEEMLESIVNKEWVMEVMR